MNQSKINAGGINQQPMDAVSAAIANSININLQSIFKQYTKRQHPMNAKLTSVHSASTSMRRVVTAIAQSINIQCALNQQPMRIALDSFTPGFSGTKTFTLSSMLLKPVILRGAEGEVAESILTESTLSKGVWDDRLQRPITL